jgi:predicted small lipoprotein YifL
VVGEIIKICGRAPHQTPEQVPLPGSYPTSLLASRKLSHPASLPASRKLSHPASLPASRKLSHLASFQVLLRISHPTFFPVLLPMSDRSSLPASRLVACLRLLAGVAASLALSSCVTACGQRGPLVLPPKAALAAAVNGAGKSTAIGSAALVGATETTVIQEAYPQ